MPKLAMKGGSPVRTASWPIWPPYTEREKELLLAVLESHNWGGYPSPNFQASHFADEFAAYSGAKYGICAANGTVTLEIALRALGITAGDEVIVPAITFMATAGAVVCLNAVPVFADIRKDNFTIDTKHAESLITKKTKAIMPVHLGSSIADMDEIMRIAAKYNLVVIEDCAHAHGARWRGKGVGAIGHAGSFSFQSSKLMTSGEGGAIITSDEMVAQKCLSLVNCGRKDFGYDEFEGKLFGWNYRIGEFQAAVLRAQLEKLQERTDLRAENAAYLTEQLKGVDGVGLVPYDERTTQKAHYQYIFTYDKRAFKGVHRDKFIDAAQAEGVGLDGDFYIPVQGNDIFRVKAADYPMIRERYGDEITRESADTPVAWDFATETGVWMHYSKLMGTKKDVDDIVAIIRKIQENAAELL